VLLSYYFFCLLQFVQCALCRPGLKAESFAKVRTFFNSPKLFCDFFCFASFIKACEALPASEKHVRFSKASAKVQLYSITSKCFYEYFQQNHTTQPHVAINQHITIALNFVNTINILCATIFMAHSVMIVK
ncbi:MAG: hypothetical protein NC043_05590, partial [Muribaculaceae bacterium]|nr:hypothetical protein [Muribaculaceae bacterium]